MNRLVILICCICAISASSVEKVKRARRPRIIGGESIGIENAPFQVSISKIDEDGYPAHSCGGSIISKNLVLTAAHCVHSNHGVFSSLDSILVEPEQYAIRSGSTLWKEGGWFHKVVKIIVHPDYKIDHYLRPHNDLAIIKIAPEFVLDGKTEKVIELAGKDDKVKPGDKAYVTGWGVTKDIRSDEKVEAEKLQSLEGVEIFDINWCRYHYKNFGNMTEDRICAQHPTMNEKSACRGDSGGPLVFNAKQVGVVSWSGPGCARFDRPGVFTDVAHYREWIDQHMDI